MDLNRALQKKYIQMIDKRGKVFNLISNHENAN